MTSVRARPWAGSPGGSALRVLRAAAPCVSSGRQRPAATPSRRGLGASENISTSASALGLKPGTYYLLDNLWTHQRTETTGPISAQVPSHGVALFRVSPLSNPAAAPRRQR